MLPKIFKPIFVNDLMRLGDKSDGGYIISNKILIDCKFCLTFGLGDNFSFEIDLEKKNKKIKFVAYDHTVNFQFWFKHSFFWLWHSIRYRNFNLRFLSFLKYIYFFKIKKNLHYKIKISKDTCSIVDVLSTNKIDPRFTLLKIDIDGDEYQIINEINKFEFLGVIIEFENFDQNIDKIEKFIINNKNLKIAHIHGNNFLNYGINNLPKAVEITFINSKYCNSNIVNKKEYPVKDLDFPNNSLKEDLKINFDE